MNEEIRDNDLILASRESYLKKEELLKILESLDYIAVKNFSVDCITGFMIEKNDKGNKYVKTLGFEIRIDWGNKKWLKK